MQVALRNIASFAEYPVRMQRKIVEVGRYERFGAKRVIVRQGQPASAFYFILSGSGTSKLPHSDATHRSVFCLYCLVFVYIEIDTSKQKIRYL